MEFPLEIASVYTKNIYKSIRVTTERTVYLRKLVHWHTEPPKLKHKTNRRIGSARGRNGKTR